MAKKNILFVTKTLNTGGVSIVSIFLANHFSKRGYNVSMFILDPNSGSESHRVDNSVTIYHGVGVKYNITNKNLLKKVLKERNIEIVINQWGLHWMTIKLIRKASSHQNIKVFTVYHNDPAANGRLQLLNIKIGNTKSKLKKSFLLLQKFFVGYVTSLSMRYVYRNTDKYLLLSHSYIDNFKKFTKLRDIKKVGVQTNPITIEKSFDESELKNKEKTIIYVGRLNYIQKRVSRILYAWSKIEKDNPSWNLKIVGDGDEKDLLKLIIKEKGIKNVSLEGFKNPINYYKTASAIVLASEYEGFPLVLPEAMSFGVIPIVYASYPAIYDIIEDNIDGFIMPYNNSFNIDNFANLMQTFMRMPPTKLLKMQNDALKKSKDYSIDVIVNQWEQKFNEVF